MIALGTLVVGPPARAQGLSIGGPDWEAKDPHVVCRAVGKQTKTIYGSSPVTNNPNIRKRYDYHAKKFETDGGEALSTECISYTSIAPQYLATFTPGASFVNTWKETRHVVASPFLPAGWAETPVPTESEDAQVRKTAIVNFQAPQRGESGYAGVTFKVEYMLIGCFGELHLAYSVVPNSVRSSNGSYWLDDRVYQVQPPSTTINAVTLNGTVTLGPVQIGRFGDNFAAQALGFGCFSGQTKKIAMLKDHLPPNPSKAQTQAFIDKLTVYLHAGTVLRSTAAESQIRRAQAAAAPPPPPELVEQRKASARGFVQSWQP